MVVEAAFQGPVKSSDDEGADDRREDSVRRQDGEVDRSREARSRERRRTETEIVGPQRVVRNVRLQERGRDRAR